MNFILLSISYAKWKSIRDKWFKLYGSDVDTISKIWYGYYMTIPMYEYNSIIFFKNMVKNLIKNKKYIFKCTIIFLKNVLINTLK